VSKLMGSADRPAGRPTGISAVRGSAGADLDPIWRLEWSIARGVAMPDGTAPWEPRPALGEVPAGLYEPFRAGGLFDHEGGDLDSVLSAFADRHEPVYRFGRQELLGRLRAHAAGGFLVTRDGVAVSHPRRPIVLPVREPTAAVCLAGDPVPLGPDGSPAVRVLIALVTPRVSDHLALLARLSRLLANDRFVQSLDGRRTHEEVMDLVWLHDCGLADEEIRIPMRLAD
jgi:hypothetical protein